LKPCQGERGSGYHAHPYYYYFFSSSFSDYYYSYHHHHHHHFYYYYYLVLLMSTPLPSCYPNNRLLKTSLILIWGRWYLPIPYRRQLLYAIGKPLQLLHTSNPTPQQLDAAHQAFCEALHDVFDKYKFIYGWGNRQLRIV